MNLETSRTAATLPRLAEVLRPFGVVLLSWRDERLAPLQQGDWLAQMLAASPLVSRAAAAARPNTAHSVVPGLRLAVIGGQAGRTRRNRFVAIVPTRSLLDSEHLVSLCHASSADVEITRHLLGALDPAADVDSDRILMLAGRLAAAETARDEADAAIESMGRQIADNYEELHLLYTTIRGMGSVRRPVHFVRLVCQELLETLSYGWIGIQLADDDARLKMLSDRLLVAGEPKAPIDAVRDAATRLLPELPAGGGRVIDGAARESDRPYSALGRSALAWPLAVDDEVIGVLIAGDKNGPDFTASSVDMKLLEATASHTAIFFENSALYDDLNATFLGTLKALAAAIDAKDRYTCGHSDRVAHLTALLAEAAGLDERTVERFHIAGLVHDVGKIGVPERVLLKPGRLDDEEFAWIRRHPDIGHKILQDIPQFYDILPAVLHHHERWDGKGYPSGLEGADIPESARFVALADAFDAMSTTRTYRPRLERPQVLEEIAACAGTQFDPELARLFVKLDFSRYDALLQEHLALEQEVCSEEDAA